MKIILEQFKHIIIITQCRQCDKDLTSLNIPHNLDTALGPIQKLNKKIQNSLKKNT